MNISLNIQAEDWKRKISLDAKFAEQIANEKAKEKTKRKVYESYFITTNNLTIIDGIIEWNSKGILQLDAMSLEDVTKFLNDYFKGKWLNIYKSIPMLGFFYKKGIVKRYKI